MDNRTRVNIQSTLHGLRLIIVLAMTVLLFTRCGMKYSKFQYPECSISEVVDTLHGVVVRDPYRWLEDSNDPKVMKWAMAEDSITRDFLDKLPQREKLINQFKRLMRYDYEGTPSEILNGDRLFYYVIKTNWERRAYFTKEKEGAEGVLLLDPNQWGEKTLSFAVPSRDGKYVAYGTGEGGKEHFKIRILDVESKKILQDTLRGYRQRKVSWLPDNTGFYYEATPLKGDVPVGEEDYWYTIWLHKLGTPAYEDKKVFFHEKVKEYYHSAEVSEDGEYVLFYRTMLNKNEFYLQKLGSNQPLTPIAIGFDAFYAINEIQGKLVIRTDLDAPKGKVYITDIDKPEKKYWKEIIPETEDILQSVAGIGGHLYAVYLHNAYTKIKIFTLEGKYLRDLPLPTLGSASVSGFWSKPTVWVIFSSFTYTPTSFQYIYPTNELRLYRRPPLDINISHFNVEQIWYKSKDETNVSMFLIYDPKIKKDGNNPVYLTGYGGFNFSVTPSFDLTNAVWLENGGMIAIPNLRGGGEYGEKWHSAGMLEKKQNVFDDFIAAAEWLIRNKFTSPKKLVIGGGSNAGLLVGAAIVQRPDLFRAASCEVPLLDMVRYHKFLFANTWSAELGSSEDPEQFKYLLKYSPYHNVVNGTKYPAILFVTRENDDRTPPLHSLKMVARMQAADISGNPILLLFQRKSGHTGGIRISDRIQQHVYKWSFLMNGVGLKIDKRKK